MFAGVPPPRDGDEHVYAAHRPVALYMETQALRLHLGQSPGG